MHSSGLVGHLRSEFTVTFSRKRQSSGKEHAPFEPLFPAIDQTLRSAHVASKLFDIDVKARFYAFASRSRRLSDEDEARDRCSGSEWIFRLDCWRSMRIYPPSAHPPGWCPAAHRAARAQRRNAVSRRFADMSRDIFERQFEFQQTISNTVAHSLNHRAKGRRSCTVLIVVKPTALAKSSAHTAGRP